MLGRGKRVGLSVALSVCGVSGGQTFTGIGHMPGGVNLSFAADVSADGTVIVGSGNTPEGRIGFRWTRSGGFEPIGSFPNAPVQSSYAGGVTTDGEVVVGGARPVSGLREWFTWTASGGLEAIPPVPNAGGYSEAYDISADRRVIVGRTDLAGVGLDLFPAVWREGVGSEVLAPLPSGAELGNCRAVSDDGSVIVGWFDLSGVMQAFRWTAVTGVVAIRPSVSQASAADQVTPDGSLIVGYVEEGGVHKAAVWRDEGMTLEVLGLLAGSVACEASGVSADGSVIVGTAEMAAGADTVFIWEAASGMRDLKMMLEAAGVNVSGWALLGELGGRPEISDDGRVVVGSGDNPAGEPEGWVVELESGCYADCDPASGAGVLDVFDFLCFQDAFVQGDPYACECDSVSTGPGVCDVFDFLCFQDAFAMGCP